MAKKLMEVIEGDFRFSEYEEDTQNWLLKIDALSKRTPEGEKVKFEDIEKLIIMLQKKYDLKMQWITLTILDDEKPWYSVSIVHKTNYSWMKTLYGMTLYELYCKVALYLYANSRSKK